MSFRVTEITIVTQRRVRSLGTCSRIVLLEKPLIEKFCVSFLSRLFFCERHIVRQRITASKPSDHRIAIGVLNAQS